jgi:hypothetical protein
MTLGSSSMTQKPNFVVEWLTLLLHIREVPGSNLDQETGYSDLGGRGFFQSLQPNAGRVP